MNQPVPQSLRAWFIVHFVIDMLVAIPVFFFPHWFLSLLGWESVDLVMTRIVGAAFFGIGIESYLGRNAGLEAYKGMLNLKIIWSATAILGISWSFFEGTEGDPLWIVLTIATFVVFHVNWVYWRIRVGRLLIG